MPDPTARPFCPYCRGGPFKNLIGLKHHITQKKSCKLEESRKKRTHLHSPAGNASLGGWQGAGAYGLSAEETSDDVMLDFGETGRNEPEVRQL